MRLRVLRRYGLLSALHPSLQDNASRDFVDKRFVSPCHFPDTAFEHRLVGHHAGVTLVPPRYGDIGQSFLQLGNKLFYVTQVLAFATVGLHGAPHDKPFHTLALDIVGQETEKLPRVDRRQPVGNYLQGVRHSNTCATDPIIYCKYSTHSGFISDRATMRWDASPGWQRGSEQPAPWCRV